MARARREVGGLMAVAPQQASVVHGDHEHRVAAASVAVGSLVRVRPGEHVPCDGEVEVGDIRRERIDAHGRAGADHEAPRRPGLRRDLQQ